MLQKIIVTGAAGFIGSHTVDQFLAAGHIVWGVDNFRTGCRENLSAAFRHKAFSFRKLDVAEKNDFADLVGRICPDAIVHLAALVSVPESIANPSLNERLNFQTTCVVAETACQFQVRRVVFASSAAVYGDPSMCPISEDAPKSPLSPYGSAKLASEALLLDYASKHILTVRCQRYFNVYGPRQDPSSPYSGVISIFQDHLNRHIPPTIFGNGEQTRDFISVFDVARANVIAATRSGLATGVVNICTGTATTLNELWRLLARDHNPILRPHYAPPRLGDIRTSCGLPTAARNTMDFQAEISLSDGLTALASRSRIGSVTLS